MTIGSFLSNIIYLLGYRNSLLPVQTKCWSEESGGNNAGRRLRRSSPSFRSKNRPEPRVSTRSPMERMETPILGTGIYRFLGDRNQRIWISTESSSKHFSVTWMIGPSFCNDPSTAMNFSLVMTRRCRLKKSDARNTLKTPVSSDTERRATPGSVPWRQLDDGEARGFDVETVRALGEILSPQVVPAMKLCATERHRAF